MATNNYYKWSSIDRIGVSAMTFAGNIVLARLLDPYDFGLLAMVAIFTSIAYNISGCGLSDGLIHKKNASATDYSTVFCFNSAMGLVFGLLFIGLSGTVAEFFGHEQLRGIMVALGICFFISTLGFTQETRMRKELSFKQIAIVRLSSTFISVVAGILMALNGMGYWALVMTRICVSAINTVMYIAISRWIPSLRFSAEAFKSLFGYGINLMLAYVATQIQRTINTSVLGKVAPAADAGLYSQAQKLEEVPFNITESIFNWPFFAVLSKETDHTQKRKLAVSMHQRILLLNFTIGLFLILISAPAIIFLYGEKWEASIPIFCVLVVFGMFTSIKYFYHTILKDSGKTLHIAILAFAELIFQLILLAIFYKNGIIWIAMTQAISATIFCIVFSGYYRRYCGSTLGEFFKELVRPIAIPVITALICLPVVGYIVPCLPAFLGCVVVVVVYFAVAALICRVLLPDILKQLVSTFKHKKE